MKKFLRIITLVLGLILSHDSLAQCSFTSPSGPIDNWNDIGYNGVIGQSFITTCSGALDTITLWVDNWTGTADLELYLYAGSSFPGGYNSNLLLIDTLSIVNAGYKKWVLSTPIPVTQGNTYSYAIRDINGASSYSTVNFRGKGISSGAYSHGGALAGNFVNGAPKIIYGPYTNRTFYFKLSIAFLACIPPSVYGVTGGSSSLCTGDTTGIIIGLANSETNITYQLKRNNNNVGSPVPGTGSAISFGTKTDAGTYTVVATRTTGGCSANMSGSAVITVNPLPTDYTVTGGGTFCGGTSTTIGLANSAAAVNYQLKRDNVNEGSPIAGTGSALSLLTTSTNGVYTVSALNPTTGCSSDMTTSAEVILSPVPTAYNVTGGGLYCIGGAGVSVGLDSSEIGVSYQLKFNNANEGTPMVGTDSAISFGEKNSVGTYTVVATSSVGNCTNNMTGNATISIASPPPANAIPLVTANNNNPCAGTTFTLTGTAPIGYTIQEYLWYKNGTPIYSQNGGNGQYTLNAGNVAVANNYAVQAIYTGYLCPSNISANNTVTTRAPQAIITPNGPTSFCANMPTLLQANTGMSTYTWKRGATIVKVGGTSYSPTVSGNYTLTVKDVYNCSKVSAATNITIKTLPVANAGADQSACLNSAAQMGAASMAGNTYTWSPTTSLSNPYISNPIVTPTSTITYTLTVNNNVTGCSNNDNVIITRLLLPPTPSITTTTTPVCEGSSVTITSSSFGVLSLNWYKNGVFLYNKPNSYQEVVSAPNLSTDNYTTKGLGANGCLSSFSNYKYIWIKPAATPTITSTPAGSINLISICVPGGTSGNAQLTANSTTPSASYQWLLSGSSIAGANAANYTANVTTTANNKVFSVRATYSNGCVKTSSSNTVKLVVTGCTPRLGTDKDGADAFISTDATFEAYPNPTNGLLNVVLSNNELANSKLLLYNNLGQVVLTKEISFFAGKANTELDLQHLAAGVYSLSFENKVIKVVKE